MRTFLLAALIVTASATSAAARDEFDQFVADLVAAPDAAKTYLKECRTLVSPAGQVRTPCTLTLADLAGAQTLVVKQNKVSSFPQSQLVYREALVEARAGKKVVGTYRVLEVGWAGGNPDLPLVIATHWARLIADKDAAAAAKSGTLPAPPAITHGIAPSGKAPSKDHDQDEVDRGQATDTLREHLTRGTIQPDIKSVIAGWAHGGAIVFGSGPKQRYTGRKGANTILKWKLALHTSNQIAIDGDAWIVWGTTHMTAKPTKPGAPEITYVVFTVFASGLTEGGGSFITFPALVSFAVPQ